MASKTIADLNALAGTAVATGDLAGIWHVADSAEEKVLVEQLLASVTRLAAASGGTITLTFASTGIGAGNDVVIKGSSAGSGATAGGDVGFEPGTKSEAGADGVFFVRQPGGTPGTDELEVSHDGTNALIKNAQTGGAVRLATPDFQVNLINNGGSTQFQDNNTAASMTLGSGGAVTFSTAAFGIDNNNSGLFQVAPGVVSALLAGLNLNGWFQNAGGHLMANTSPTNNTATLASTNLAWTLIAGRSYSIKGKISGGNSTATEGFQFALTADGTLTATTFDLSVVGSLGTVVAGTQRVTSLGTAITFTTFTAPSDVSFVGEIKCGVSGVMTLQFAENSTAVGTATLNAGSWVELNDSRAV